MKRKFIITVILILFITIFSGCNASEKLSYRIQGKKNAVQYIKEKYGFKPTVKNVSVLSHSSSPIPFSLPSPSGYVEVKMKYDDKIFYVYISGLNKNTDGVDNYQSDLIEDKLKEELIKLLPDAIRIDTCFGSSCATSSDWDFGMVSTYFDGENLSEVLNSARLNRAVVSVADSDISKITDKIVHELFGKNAEYFFVNYRSVKDLRKCEDLSYEIGTSEFGYDIEQNALYITEYKHSDYTNFISIDFPLNNYGDLIYSYWKGTYCDIHVLTEEEINTLNIRAETQEKCNGNYYSFYTDASSVIVYVPTSWFPDIQTDNICLYEIEDGVNGEYYGDSVETFMLENGKYIGAVINKPKKDQIIISFGK